MGFEITSPPSNYIVQLGFNEGGWMALLFAFRGVNILKGVFKEK